MIRTDRIQLQNRPYYPYRDTFAVNVLESYKSTEPVGDEIKILFLGCVDLRNILKTVSAGNVEHFQFHLNCSSPLVLARNILILKIITSQDFDTKNDEDVAFLWDVWYNMDWPEKTQHRFELVLFDLLDNVLPENITTPNDSQSLENIRAVWLSWWLFVGLTHLESQSARKSMLEKINEERLNSIVEGWRQLHSKDINPQGIYSKSLIPEAVDNFAFHLDSKFKHLGDETRKKVHEEARLFFSKGSCRLQNRNSNDAFVNPTMMLDPTTPHWNVAPKLSPFDSFLPLSEEELDMSDGEILIRSCQKILRTQIAGYRSRLETVKIVFHLEDPMKFCYSDTTNLYFDVIDCSTLSDTVGLVNLIVGSSKKLADSPEAVLLTESTNWFLLAISAVEYVEEALSSPLSMIPTLYGLRLTNHVELGSSLPTLESFLLYTVKLCWKKALPFRNVVPSPSPELSRWFQELAKKCFLVGKGWAGKYQNDNSPKPCGMLCYTPLTFSYAVNSIIQRVGGDCFKDIDKLELPSVFRLTWRTFEDWKNNEIVMKFSAVLKGSPFQNLLLQQLLELKRTPVLRLMLIPWNEVVHCYEQCVPQIRSQQRPWLNVPNAHVIENFEMDVQKTSDGNIEQTVVSFLLVPNHGIENTHCAVLFELITGVAIVNSGLVSAMRVTKYDQTFPWNSRVPPLLPHLSAVRMDVKSCNEDPYQYAVEIMIECVGNISGLKVSTNQCLPCESIHDVTLSLSQPNNMEPLVLSFPHPILVNEIRATLHRTTRSIKLVLKKAIWEPWPCEFEVDHCKLNADCLKPWEKDKCLLFTHLLGSVARTHDNSSNPQTLALKKVRDIVKTLFVESTINGHEYVRIQREGSTGSPDWYIRIHLPHRVTPLSAPLSIISAVDKRLTETLVQQGKLDNSRADKDLLRIWESPRCKKFANGKGNPLTILIGNAEEAQLLRFVLRLNSTKITPSAWQRKNLPLGENSPWLATFISPLYQDNPLDTEYVESKISPSVLRHFEGKQVNDRIRCAACQTISPYLKQCGRCRNIFYCGVQCQRGDWVNHKSACSKQ